ncbi:MAG: GNAT family N-acetyltransferase [Bacteroidota bacterium]
MKIRTDLRVGDLSFLQQSHTEFYYREYQYTVPFEYYVGKAISEFYESYTPERSRIWMVEKAGRRVGSLVLQDRGTAAQLRFFLLLPEVQGEGIGKSLLQQFLAFCRDKGYQSAYFWTTDEQLAAGHLYRSVGFQVTEEKESMNFGRKTLEQRYELWF